MLGNLTFVDTEEIEERRGLGVSSQIIFAAVVVGATSALR
jgi:hypothetical protein